MPILFICGDSEGQDELVGRQLMYHSIQDKAHICHYCGISYDNTNNPYMRASETMARAIENYISTKNHSKLKMIGYLLIDRNALHQVEFCDNVHGLNGSLPANLLHTWELGMYQYVIQGLLVSKKACVRPIEKKKQ
jgi:hypothetical protein